MPYQDHDIVILYAPKHPFTQRWERIVSSMRDMPVVPVKVDIPRMVDVHYGGFSWPASEKLDILEDVKDVLEGLLAYAISADAVGRTQCVEHILSLDRSHQQQLKAIIEEQMLKRAAMQDNVEEEQEAQGARDMTSATDEEAEDTSGAAGEQGEVLIRSLYNFSIARCIHLFKICPHNIFPHICAFTYRLHRQ